MRYPEFYTHDELILLDKALKCIEALAEDNCPGPTNHPVDCKWCEVFQIAHAGRSPSCHESHLSWEEQIKRLYERLSQ